MKLLSYGEEVIAEVTDNAETITMAFEEIGINIFTNKGLKEGFNRGIPGFYRGVNPLKEEYGLNYFGFRLERVIPV